MIKNLPSCIKSRRQNIGLTQKQLAQKVNLTDVTISRYETGQREPSWSDFLSICKVLGMNPNDFIEKESGDIQTITIGKINLDNAMTYDEYAKKMRGE